MSIRIFPLNFMMYAHNIIIAITTMITVVPVLTSRGGISPMMFLIFSLLSSMSSFIVVSLFFT